MKKKTLISLAITLGFLVPTNIKAATTDPAIEDQAEVENFFSGQEEESMDRRWPIRRKHWCVAVDRGWEEHRYGHAGYGWTNREAAYSALANCRRFHGPCVLNQCGVY